MTATVTPCRIRLRRRKGYLLAEASTNPNGVVNVARPGKWGNPHKIRGAADMWISYDDRTGKVGSWHNSRLDAQAAAVRDFDIDLVAGLLPFTVADVERELEGKDVACWCADGDPCHGLTLLAVANGWEVPT